MRGLVKEAKNGPKGLGEVSLVQVRFVLSETWTVAAVLARATTPSLHIIDAGRRRGPRRRPTASTRVRAAARARQKVPGRRADLRRCLRKCQARTGRRATQAVATAGRLGFLTCLFQYTQCVASMKNVVRTTACPRAGERGDYHSMQRGRNSCDVNSASHRDRPKAPYPSGGPFAAILPEVWRRRPRREIGRELPRKHEMSVDHLPASGARGTGQSRGVHLATTCFSAKARNAPPLLPS